MATSPFKLRASLARKCFVGPIKSSDPSVFPGTVPSSRRSPPPRRVVRPQICLACFPKWRDELTAAKYLAAKEITSMSNITIDAEKTPAATAQPVTETKAKNPAKGTRPAAKKAKPTKLSGL